MLRFLALIGGLTLLTAAPAHARTEGGDLLWQDRFDVAPFASGSNALAPEVAASGGRVVAVGGAYDSAGNSDIVVRAHDAKTGAILWTDRVDVAGGMDLPSKVVMDDRRVVVVGGSRDAASTEPLALIRTYAAKTGVLVWEDTLSGPFSMGVAMNSSRVVVAGAVPETADTRQLVVRAYVAKTGAIAWEDRSAPPPGFRAGGVLPRGVVIRSGKVYVAALVGGPDVFTTACLVRAYSIARGTLLWQSTGAIVGRCVPWAIDTDGHQVVISGQGSIGDSEFSVLGFDADSGALLWQDRSFIGGTPAISAAVAVAIDGGQVFAAGWQPAVPLGPFDEAFIVRSLDADTGVLRWQSVHQDTETLGSILWHGLDVEASKGRVFAVGQHVEGPGTWLVRSYKARNGEVLWEDTFEPTGVGAGFAAAYGWTQGLALDGGRLFVVGSGVNAVGNVDLILRAYDAK